MQHTAEKTGGSRFSRRPSSSILRVKNNTTKRSRVNECDRELDRIMELYAERHGSYPPLNTLTGEPKHDIPRLVREMPIWLRSSDPIPWTSGSCTCALMALKAAKDRAASLALSGRYGTDGHATTPPGLE